jgi:hypothetical protein
MGGPFPKPIMVEIGPPPPPREKPVVTLNLGYRDLVLLLAVSVVAPTYVIWGPWW